jgi:hypothetical protein
MSTHLTVEAALVEWGERLFYPANRIVKSSRTPRLTALSFGQRAAAVRARLEATVLRRAPQVMVRVTGGGRGMGAIAAHFRYIAKAGRLPFEDDRGAVREGKDALRALTDQWRYGGAEIGGRVRVARPSTSSFRCQEARIRSSSSVRLANSRGQSLRITAMSWSCMTTRPIRMCI